MISIRELDFHYEADSFSLKIPSLDVGAGERVACVGPSGSGKTTLLNLVAGILATAKGKVEVCDVNLTGLGDSARRDFRISSIGLVFQEFELLDYLTVLDNVLLPFRINRSMQLTPEARETSRELLAQVGLADVAHRRPDHLSHGQRQRVAVCRALSTMPKLVLADEPTASLDEANKLRVLDMLDAHVQRAGATLIVVTHDDEVTRRFDRTINIASITSDTSTVDVLSQVR